MAFFQVFRLPEILIISTPNGVMVGRRPILRRYSIFVGWVFDPPTSRKACYGVGCQPTKSPQEQIKCFRLPEKRVGNKLPTLQLRCRWWAVLSHPISKKTRHKKRVFLYLKTFSGSLKTIYPLRWVEDPPYNSFRQPERRLCLTLDGF